MASRVLNATLVAIAEHGLVPSVQASRMTLAAAPDAIQGAVAAGILGCGSVILGASETAGRLFLRIDALAQAKGLSLRSRRQRGGGGPARAEAGHPRLRPPAAQGSATRAWMRCSPWRREAGAPMATSWRLPRRWKRCCPGHRASDLRLNVSAAIPAVLLDVGFPAECAEGRAHPGALRRPDRPPDRRAERSRSASRCRYQATRE
jgi:citrate synthase